LDKHSGSDLSLSILLDHGVEGNTVIQMSKKEKGTFYITNDGGLIFWWSRKGWIAQSKTLI
jgi:hypothetical protein|tara:strand:+ start:160 stop:342 length:183 start_codon:yes stop_codon:yes gene_type:complete